MTIEFIRWAIEHEAKISFEYKKGDTVPRIILTWENEEKGKQYLSSPIDVKEFEVFKYNFLNHLSTVDEDFKKIWEQEIINVSETDEEVTLG